MNLSGRNYTRTELLRRVGNPAQLGGARHSTLNDGRSKGVAAVDVDTGSGFRFTVLPDRGMDISLASFRGLNLVYLTPTGEAHPAYYEPQGPGWLRTFFGGLLTTCGLTYLGPPGKDADEELGLHGRYATSPVGQFRDNSRWDGDDYVVELTGTVEEAVLFGDKLRLTRTITTAIGRKSLVVSDVVENFGYKTSPFTILYHVNAGFPLLDEASRVVVTASKTEPCDARSAEGLGRFHECSAPAPGFAEENFLHTMAGDDRGDAWAALVNPELAGGLGLYVRFDVRSLPYLNQWKMLAEGDYVVAIEPCNAPCENRAELRGRGLLPSLAPGGQWKSQVEIGVLDGPGEIDPFLEKLRSVRG
ncbi:MAG: aldose 1-epimerase family protein [Pirellulales bacterium]|nr:aldose 1-epimerase family protein [Pirellulales bacterium]